MVQSFQQRVKVFAGEKVSTRIFVENSYGTYSLECGSSKTSTAGVGMMEMRLRFRTQHMMHLHWTTRALAVRSSLPTVMRTGERRNVLARRLTDSGQVALTGKARIMSARTENRTSKGNVHISVCRLADSAVCPIMVRMSFSNPLSSIRSASSRTR